MPLADYVKTDWIDKEEQPSGTPDVDAGNLDKLENGVYDVTEFAQALDVRVTDLEGSAALTADDILNMLKTVDGSGSGLDADLLDGLSSASFLQTSALGSTVAHWSVASCRPHRFPPWLSTIPLPWLPRPPCSP